MKIVWMAHPVEAESDIIRAAHNHSDIDLSVVSVLNPSQEELCSGKVVGFSRERVLSLAMEIAAGKPDMVVMRYPYWISRFGVLDEFHNIFKDVNVVAWTSEQGP